MTQPQNWWVLVSEIFFTRPKTNGPCISKKNSKTGPDNSSYNAYQHGILYRFAKITKLGLIYHIRSYNTITTKDDAIQKNWVQEGNGSKTKMHIQNCAKTEQTHNSTYQGLTHIYSPTSYRYHAISDRRNSSQGYISQALKQHNPTFATSYNILSWAYNAKLSKLICDFNISNTLLSYINIQRIWGKIKDLELAAMCGAHRDWDVSR